GRGEGGNPVAHEVDDGVVHIDHLVVLGHRVEAAKAPYKALVASSTLSPLGWAGNSKAYRG
ncbi:hypothetical protein, partial [Streptomyces katrae]|uniref:hypothetical protein n=1 Tax=Streptomyces katrae TaxID=68223 RepID=UPI001B7FF18F